MEDEHQLPVVIDAGSSLFRAGIAGEDAPTCVFPSSIGSFRFSKEDKAYGFVGGENLQNMQDLLSLRCPIERGIITNWDDMELLISHSYKELKVDPKEIPMLYNETPCNPISQQERFAQMMFESFESPSICITSSSYSCLYNCTHGRNGGVMVNIGDGVTYAVPFSESYCLRSAVHRQDFAGRDITRCLQKSLFTKGHSFTTTSEFETLQRVKENHAYTALDFDAEMLKKSKDVNSLYKLSDGTDLNLEKEKFTCMEALFQPSKFGFQGFLSIQEMIYRSIESCDLSTKADIIETIIVAGGTALNAGFKERLKKEMELLLPKNKRSNVLVFPESQYSVWIGGSIVGTLLGFGRYLIDKQKYEEYGPSVVRMSNIHM